MAWLLRVWRKNRVIHWLHANKKNRIELIFNKFHFFLHTWLEKKKKKEHEEVSRSILSPVKVSFLQLY